MQKSVSHIISIIYKLIILEAKLIINEFFVLFVLRYFKNPHGQRSCTILHVWMSLPRTHYAARNTNNGRRIKEIYFRNLLTFCVMVRMIHNKVRM